jgi:thiol-disulfide isomerase/thioredoxin
MNWGEYRSNHYATYGSTSRAQLSQDYAAYKKSLKQKSPSKRNNNKVIVSPKKNIKQTSPRRIISKQNNKYTLKNIEDMAKNKKFLIVVIYADFCGHCRDMKERLGKKMKNTDKIIFISDDKLDNSLKEYYPRILHFQNGDRVEDLIIDDVYTYLNA